MSEERIPCKNPACARTILPATAAANDGLCAVCLREQLQAEHAEYVRRNRRAVNPYEGVTDPVELVRLILTPRQWDELIEYSPPPATAAALVSTFTREQAEKLMAMARDGIRSGDVKFAEGVAGVLAAATAYPLDPVLEALVTAGTYFPDFAFRRAGPLIRDRILRSMSEDPGGALAALAWIGDDVVQKQFALWERRPPAWREELYIGPAGYAHGGGWELTPKGRRDLFHEPCFGLGVAESPDAASAVKAIVGQPEPCPWCGDALVHLLEIPTAQPEFAFLEFAGERLPVLTCERCTCCSAGHVFAQVRPDGTAQWFAGNQRPESISEGTFGPGPWSGVPIALQPRPALAAADEKVAKSQIGGLPHWDQDSAYPACPKCGVTMKFIAQLDNGQFPNYEGSYYAFLCAPCRITATGYQQT